MIRDLTDQEKVDLITQARERFTKNKIKKHILQIILAQHTPLWDYVSEGLVPSNLNNGPWCSAEDCNGLWPCITYILAERVNDTFSTNLTHFVMSTEDGSMKASFSDLGDAEDYIRENYDAVLKESNE